MDTMKILSITLASFSLLCSLFVGMSLLADRYDKRRNRGDNCDNRSPRL